MRFFPAGRVPRTDGLVIGLDDEVDKGALLIPCMGDKVTTLLSNRRRLR
jgi:hypothetical protein